MLLLAPVRSLGYEGLSTEPHAGLQNKNSFLVLSKEELVCILSLMTWLVTWRR